MVRILMLFLFLPHTLVKACNFFTTEEQKYLLEFWNQPGRYSINQPSSNNAKGIWRVRLSVEASKWIYEFNKKIGISFSAVSTKSTQNSTHQEWLKWVEKKIEFDRYQAFSHTSMLNKEPVSNLFSSSLPLPHPGLMPEGLKILMGDAPCFVEVVAPLEYTVIFSDNKPYHYHDYTHFNNSKYSYYRFSRGVDKASVSLSNWQKEERDHLFQEAGIDSSAQKVMQAVSLLEGGFSKVNTYDTGYVSVGFIQFASTDTGRGSLGSLLKFYKETDPNNFKKDFHNFGVEVDKESTIIVVNPSTGVILNAKEAALKIIEDKRLTAVFERAGKESRPFQIAQIKTCYQKYYPGNLSLQLSFGKNKKKVQIKEIIRSEAGLATLLDRLINLGNLSSVISVIKEFAHKYQVSDPLLLAQYEKEIIQRLKYRKDFLKDSKLTQPGALKENTESYVKVIEEGDLEEKSQKDKTSTDSTTNL